MIVRSTLEVATLLKVVYPAYEETLTHIEDEVNQAGQRMLSSHSSAQVNIELKRILQVRHRLDELKQQAENSRSPVDKSDGYGNEKKFSK